MNLVDIEEKVCALTLETGRFIQEQKTKLKAFTVEEKSFNNLVTNVDKESELRLVKGLSDIIPDSGFIAEEGSGTQNNHDYQWVIDPIDGTTNFIHGLPCFSISIALRHKGKCVLGVVYEINQNELFHTSLGRPAFLNGSEIHVSQRPSLSSSLLATGFPYDDFSRFDGYLEVFTALAKTTRGLRRMGSAAVDLAYVACGRFEGYFEYALHPWDVSAGAFLVQQAGGKVTSFSGDDSYDTGKEILATNKDVHPELLTLMKKHF